MPLPVEGEAPLSKQILELTDAIHTLTVQRTGGSAQPEPSG
jgi:hypothetical protein